MTTKLQFMQLIGQWINNPSSIGNSIALKGPMGTGKTTLLKHGISKLLNRESDLSLWAARAMVRIWTDIRIPTKEAPMEKL